MMPQVMTAVRGAVGDARKEVKKAADDFLRAMGQDLVLNPEIRAMSTGIIESIVDSANMDKATEILTRMGNTTFMNTAGSFSAPHAPGRLPRRAHSSPRARTSPGVARVASAPRSSCLRSAAAGAGGVLSSEQ